MEYELYHHGILGMKWGIRRYQNPDGSLTPAGRKRLERNSKNVEKARRNYEKAGVFKRAKARKQYDAAKDRYVKFSSKLKYAQMSDEELLSASKDFVKANSATTTVLTGPNVKAGESNLAEKIKLLSSIVSLGTDTAALVGKIKDVHSSGKDKKIKRDLDERRLRLEERQKSIDERKQALDERKQKDAERKTSIESSKDRRYWESFRKNVELSKEEKDEIKRKSK